MRDGDVGEVCKARIAQGHERGGETGWRGGGGISNLNNAAVRREVLIGGRVEG